MSEPRDRDGRPAQGVPHPAWTAGGGAGLDLAARRRRARLPGSERVRQDHDDPDAARPGPGHGRRMRLFGQPVPSLLPSVVNRVGAVVESPKFSPNLSGRQNLLLLARSIGAPATRVDASVETVGLTGA